MKKQEADLIFKPEFMEKQKKIMENMRRGKSRTFTGIIRKLLAALGMEG